VTVVKPELPWNVKPKAM